MPIALILAGGSTVFGVFLVIFLLAVIHGLYTTRGSGIAQRPYRKGHSTMSADRAATNWLTRGTRS